MARGWHLKRSAFCPVEKVPIYIIILQLIQVLSLIKQNAFGLGN